MPTVYEFDEPTTRFHTRTSRIVASPDPNTGPVVAFELLDYADRPGATPAHPLGFPPSRVVCLGLSESLEVTDRFVESDWQSRDTLIDAAPTLLTPTTHVCLVVGSHGEPDVGAFLQGRLSATRSYWVATMRPGTPMQRRDDFLSGSWNEQVPGAQYEPLCLGGQLFTASSASGTGISCLVVARRVIPTPDTRHEALVALELDVSSLEVLRERTIASQTTPGLAADVTFRDVKCTTIADRSSRGWVVAWNPKDHLMAAGVTSAFVARPPQRLVTAPLKRKQPVPADDIPGLRAPGTRETIGEYALAGCNTPDGGRSNELLVAYLVEETATNRRILWTRRLRQTNPAGGFAPLEDVPRRLGPSDGAPQLAFDFDTDSHWSLLHAVPPNALTDDYIPSAIELPDGVDFADLLRPGRWWPLPLGPLRPPPPRETTLDARYCRIGFSGAVYERHSLGSRATTLGMSLTHEVGIGGDIGRVLFVHEVHDPGVVGVRVGAKRRAAFAFPAESGECAVIGPAFRPRQDPVGVRLSSVPLAGHDGYTVTLLGGPREHAVELWLSPAQRQDVEEPCDPRPDMDHPGAVRLPTMTDALGQASERVRLHENGLLTSLFARSASDLKLRSEILDFPRIWFAQWAWTRTLIDRRAFEPWSDPPVSPFPRPPAGPATYTLEQFSRSMVIVIG